MRSVKSLTVFVSVRTCFCGYIFSPFFRKASAVAVATDLLSLIGLSTHPLALLMSPSELSSIKWEEDGEMSARDTWNLVKKLTKVEEDSKVSNLLHLSSKYSHSKTLSRK